VRNCIVPTIYVHQLILSLYCKSVRPNINKTSYGRDRKLVTVSDRERPDVSGPIRSSKMYSNAHCTMQERLVCCGDVPYLAIWSRDLAPSTLSNYPSPYLPGVMGTQYTSSPQEGWAWTVEWTFATSPTRIL
jgi:hypothetical protein